MRFYKIRISGEMAHFKNGINGKNQNTFKVPPISTIVGIIKNLWGTEIKDFVFGYTCQYSKIFKDVTNIYKEVNLDVSSAKSDRFQKDIVFIEYLVDPVITIYITLNPNDIKLHEILNLGKMNCLAKYNVSKEKIDIVKRECIGFNQWTPISLGDGKIRRINKETVYNNYKGYYDYYTDLFRINNEFIAPYTVINSTLDTSEGILLWHYKGVGDIECYRESV